VHVLSKMVHAVRPGGIVLDLQAIRPNPRVAVDSRCVCEIDGEPLLLQADAATAAIDALILAGGLMEQATDDHDVLKHYPHGADLVDDFANKDRRLPDGAIPTLRGTSRPCIVRERCRLRRLAVTSCSARATSTPRSRLIS
jgi:hypothetical protein